MKMSAIPFSVCVPYLRRVQEELSLQKTVNDALPPGAKSGIDVDISIDGCNGGENDLKSCNESRPTEFIHDPSPAVHFAASTSVLPAAVVDQLMTASDAFHAKHEYPVDANRVRHVIGKGIASKDQVGRDLIASYPILHEDVIPLLCAFLDSKKCHGSQTEKELYRVRTREDGVGEG